VTAGGSDRAEPTVAPFGDVAVLITFPGEASLASAARAQALARRIRATVGGRGGWGASVPAAASVLVHVDPIEPGVVAAMRVLAEVAAALGPDDDRWPDGGQPIEIAVRYGGEDGPDLSAVAELTGLSPAQVVDLHASATYRVLFLGFAPGFGYLGPLPRELVVPRRATPRVRVAGGSVAVAGPYTAVYPGEGPGGWHLLGRTSARIWDPRRDPPATLEPGGIVRFIPEAT
jgi:KipI family sensor histidine kinase inhibitor